MSTEKNDAAFAKAAFYHPEGGIDSPQSGLTKREYFAAMAMQGILADPDNQGYAEGIAKDAVKIADELITQLNQTK